MNLKLLLTILVSSSLLAIVTTQTFIKTNTNSKTVTDCNNNITTYYDYFSGNCTSKKTLGQNCMDLNTTIATNNGVNGNTETYVQISCITGLYCNGTCKSICVNDTYK